MAEIRDIIAEQGYVGNANLGSGTSGVITFDSSPITELARFTMFQNKANYDQRQKDIDAKVAELATFTALDLNGTRAKDKDQLLNQWDEVQKLSSEYARYTPTSQRDKVDKQLEYEKKLSLLKNNINSGNKRAIAYGVRLNDINANGALSGAEKNAKLQKLNKEFDSTDITTPIRAEDNYTVEIPTLPKSTSLEFDVTEKMPNGVLVTSNGVFDGAKADAVAFSFLNGLNVEPLPANATEREKEEYDARVRAFKKGGAALYTQGVDLLNAAINDPKYKNADGTINYDLIKANNKLAANALGIIDGWNNYAQEVVNKIDNGAFYDKTGIRPISTIIDKDGYLQIDKTKPISAQQLVKAQMWANAQSDKKKEKFDYTGENIQQQNATTARIKANLDGDEFKLKEKQWQATQSGGEVVKNGALQFAKNLYGQLIGLADQKLVDGAVVITPDKVRQMNNEQLKYLGITTPTEQGGMKLDALVLPKNAAIQIKGNQIQVLENATLGDDGIWRGDFNNTKSTTLTNIATNRLNEELKNAGTKELNSYLPQDLQDGTTVSINNTGTTKSSSGGSAQSRTGKDGKVYTSADGITWVAPDGTTVVLKSK